MRTYLIDDDTGRKIEALDSGVYFEKNQKIYLTTGNTQEERTVYDIKLIFHAEKENADVIQEIYVKSNYE